MNLLIDILDYSSILLENVKNIKISDFKLSTSQIQLLLISHICWWVIYGFTHFFIKIGHKTKKETYDSKTRIVSIIHAIYASTLGFIDFFFYQNYICGENNNELQNFVITTSMSYFIYDTINCIILNVSDIEMVFHHTFVSIAYFCGICYNNSAAEMLMGLLVADVSNPIMHLRQIFRNYGLKHTKAYLYLDLIYMFVYVIARSVFGVMACSFTVFCKRNLFIVKISALFVWGQSLLFIKRMIKNFKNRYSDYCERKEKNIYYFWLDFNKKVEDLDYYKKSIKKIKEEYIP
jgi:hypothetical protein